MEQIRWDEFSGSISDIEFGEDGDFQMRRFVDIVNSDLCNTIGNLLNRTITMSKKWFKENIPIDFRFKYIKVFIVI